MRMSALFVQKNFKIFEIYGVSAQTREEGLSQCGHAGSIFRDFVWTSFMDGP